MNFRNISIVPVDDATPLYDLCCLPEIPEGVVTAYQGGLSSYNVCTSSEEWTVRGSFPGLNHDISCRRVITDENGHLFVVDVHNNCILLFTSAGQYKGILLSHFEHKLGQITEVAWCKGTSSLVLAHADCATFSLTVFKVAKHDSHTEQTADPWNVVPAKKQTRSDMSGEENLQKPERRRGASLSEVGHPWDTTSPRTNVDEERVNKEMEGVHTEDRKDHRYTNTENYVRTSENNGPEKEIRSNNESTRSREPEQFESEGIIPRDEADKATSTKHDRRKETNDGETTPGGQPDQVGAEGARCHGMADTLPQPAGMSGPSGGVQASIVAARYGSVQSFISPRAQIESSRNTEAAVIRDPWKVVKSTGSVSRKAEPSRSPRKRPSRWDTAEPRRILWSGPRDDDADKHEIIIEELSKPEVTDPSKTNPREETAGEQSKNSVQVRNMETDFRPISPVPQRKPVTSQSEGTDDHLTETTKVAPASYAGDIKGPLASGQTLWDTGSKSSESAQKQEEDEIEMKFFSIGRRRSSGTPTLDELEDRDMVVMPVSSDEPPIVSAAARVLPPEKILDTPGTRWVSAPLYCPLSPAEYVRANEQLKPEVPASVFNLPGEKVGHESGKGRPEVSPEIFSSPTSQHAPVFFEQHKTQEGDDLQEVEETRRKNARDQEDSSSFGNQITCDPVQQEASTPEKDAVRPTSVPWKTDLLKRLRTPASPSSTHRSDQETTMIQDLSSMNYVSERISSFADIGTPSDGRKNTTQSKNETDREMSSPIHAAGRWSKTDDLSTIHFGADKNDSEKTRTDKTNEAKDSVSTPPSQVDEQDFPWIKRKMVISEIPLPDDLPPSGTKKASAAFKTKLTAKEQETTASVGSTEPQNQINRPPNEPSSIAAVGKGGLRFKPMTISPVKLNRTNPLRVPRKLNKPQKLHLTTDHDRPTDVSPVEYRNEAVASEMTRDQEEVNVAISPECDAHPHRSREETASHQAAVVHHTTSHRDKIRSPRGNVRKVSATTTDFHESVEGSNDFSSLENSTRQKRKVSNRESASSSVRRNRESTERQRWEISSNDSAVPEESSRERSKGRISEFDSSKDGSSRNLTPRGNCVRTLTEGSEPLTEGLKPSPTLRNENTIASAKRQQQPDSLSEYRDTNVQLGCQQSDSRRTSLRKHQSDSVPERKGLDAVPDKAKLRLSKSAMEQSRSPENNQKEWLPGKQAVTGQSDEPVVSTSDLPQVTLHSGQKVPAPPWSKRKRAHVTSQAQEKFSVHKSKSDESSVALGTSAEVVTRQISETVRGLGQAPMIFPAFQRMSYPVTGWSFDSTKVMLQAESSKKMHSVDTRAAPRGKASSWNRDDSELEDDDVSQERSNNTRLSHPVEEDLNRGKNNQSRAADVENITVTRNRTSLIAEDSEPSRRSTGRTSQMPPTMTLSDVFRSQLAALQESSQSRPKVKALILEKGTALHSHHQTEEQNVHKELRAKSSGHIDRTPKAQGTKTIHFQSSHSDMRVEHGNSNVKPKHTGGRAKTRLLEFQPDTFESETEHNTSLPDSDSIPENSATQTNRESSSRKSQRNLSESENSEDQSTYIVKRTQHSPSKTNRMQRFSHGGSGTETEKKRGTDDRVRQSRKRSYEAASNVETDSSDLSSSETSSWDSLLDEASRYMQRPARQQRDLYCRPEERPTDWKHSHQVPSCRQAGLTATKSGATKRKLASSDVRLEKQKSPGSPTVLPRAVRRHASPSPPGRLISKVRAVSPTKGKGDSRSKLSADGDRALQPKQLRASIHESSETRSGQFESRRQSSERSESQVGRSQSQTSPDSTAMRRNSFEWSERSSERQHQRRDFSTRGRIKHSFSKTEAHEATTGKPRDGFSTSESLNRRDSFQLSSRSRKGATDSELIFKESNKSNTAMEGSNPRRSHFDSRKRSSSQSEVMADAFKTFRDQSENGNKQMETDHSSTANRQGSQSQIGMTKLRAECKRSNEQEEYVKRPKRSDANSRYFRERDSTEDAKTQSPSPKDQIAITNVQPSYDSTRESPPVLEESAFSSRQQKAAKDRSESPVKFSQTVTVNAESFLKIDISQFKKQNQAPLLSVRTVEETEPRQATPLILYSMNRKEIASENHSGKQSTNPRDLDKTARTHVFPSKSAEMNETRLENRENATRQERRDADRVEVEAEDTVISDADKVITTPPLEPVSPPGKCIFTFRSDESVLQFDVIS